MRACERACVRASVRACVRACERACVSVRVCVCVCVCVCVFVFVFQLLASFTSFGQLLPCAHKRIANNIVIYIYYNESVYRKEQHASLNDSIPLMFDPLPGALFGPSLGALSLVTKLRY